MTKLAIKLFGYTAAQTILTRTDGDTHWYSADNICRLLGIKGYSTAVHRNNKKSAYNLTSSEWKLQTEYIGTSNRRFLMVNDVGMLKLVMKGKPDINGDIQKTASVVLGSMKK